MENNFNLGNFNISYNNFIKYQNIVRSVLLKLYKSKIINIEGINFISNLPFDNPNRIKSIINYAPSNIYLCASLIKEFDLKNEKELISFIYDNKNELFLKNGKYFNKVIDKLTRTENVGVKNEKLAAKQLSFYIKNKLNKNIEVIRTETDCKDDLMYGIDLYFYIDNKKYTCQVKPLKSISNLGDSFVVKSSGKIKKYDVDYLIFVNSFSNKIVLFQNKGVSLNGYNLIIDKKSLVKLN